MDEILYVVRSSKTGRIISNPAPQAEALRIAAEFGGWIEVTSARTEADLKAQDAGERYREWTLKARIARQRMDAYRFKMCEQKADYWRKRTQRLSALAAKEHTS